MNFKSMSILSIRLSFLILCLVIAFLTVYLIKSSCLQTGQYSLSAKDDIDVNVYLQNHTRQNPRTEFRDGKLVITYEIQAQSKEIDEIEVLNTKKVKMEVNQTTTSESDIQKDENFNIVTENQTGTFTSTQSIIPETTTSESNIQKDETPTVVTENQKVTLALTPSSSYETTISESTTLKDEIPNNVTKNKNVTVTLPSSQSSIPDTLKMFPFTIGENPYNINNTMICEGIKDILFLVLVHTTTEHFTRRQSFRETWANFSLYQTHKMRIVFLLGLPSNDSLQRKIKEENYFHGDLVQGNFIDSYRNLTHKGVMGLRWVTEHCKQAKFIVKIDDAVFVNTLLVIENVLAKHLNASRMIIGSVQKSARIQRTGKWKVEENDFFNMTRYPFPYCLGYFVILTGDIIGQLYEAAKVTPFFWIDDVYLFGILPEKVGNITFLPLKEKKNDEHTAVICYVSREKPCDLVATYAYSDGVMHKMWQWACKQNEMLAIKYLTTNDVST